jgi:DNA repair exonuclease SbcCD ATPase subunit
MKLTHIEISGFGGIADKLFVPLDADVIILAGSNGFGKTTMCDAIAWALTGSHPRGADPRSLYSRSGETYVRVGLASGAGESVSVIRTISDPNESRTEHLSSALTVDLGGKPLRGSKATEWLASAILHEGASGDDWAVDSGLFQSVYMQQESLRDFLSRVSDSERFMALSRMVGAGALSELVSAFDTAKTAWTRATNKLEQEIEPLRIRLSQAVSAREVLTSQRERLRSGDFSLKWSSWLSRVIDVTGGKGATHAEGMPVQGDAYVSLTQGLDALRGEAARLRRREESLTAVAADLRIPVADAAHVKEERQAQEELTARLEKLRELEAQYESADAALEAARLESSKLRAQRDELAVMAEIALRHVGDRCPTCGQTVNEADFRERALALVAARTSATEDPGLSAATERRASLERQLSDARGTVKRLTAVVQEASDRQSLRVAARARLNQRLSDLGITSASAGDDQARVARVVADALGDVTARLAQVTDLIAEGDGLSTLLAGEASEARLEQAAADVRKLEAQLGASERDLEARRRTGTRAEIILNALRADADAFVASRLREIQPILDQLYSAIDPHPTFRNLWLETHLHYGKPRLDPRLRDDATDVTVQEPGKTLSTSQANALAVALFLAFNLGLAPTRLQTLIMDDPLQNLDDVHLLGLVDLLRRVSPYRQLLITTHDDSFARLLARKLRPVGEGRVGVVLRIVSWDRSGPRVAVESLPKDSQPLKIALAG